MNDKLLSHDGGQPVFADDLTFLQNSLKSYINALAKTYGDTYILYGVINDTRTEIVPGAVVVNGVLYEVPALGPINGQKLCFRSVDYDPRVYENSSTNNVKNRIDVYLGSDAAGTIVCVDPASLQKISGRIYQVLHGECTRIDNRGFEIKFDENFDLDSNAFVTARLNFKYGSVLNQSVSCGLHLSTEEGFSMFWNRLNGEMASMEVTRDGVVAVYQSQDDSSTYPDKITDVLFFVIKL